MINVMIYSGLAGAFIGAGLVFVVLGIVGVISPVFIALAFVYFSLAAVNIWGARCEARIYNRKYARKF
jgi:uncharacterized membrane protein YbaN (DUF454 family)